MNKICILGSINMDMVLKVDKMPKEGETILCNCFEKIPGGKGANQAVAAKRSGGDVYMISKVGEDENGIKLKEKLKEDNINIDYVFKDKENPTGVAIITVNYKGNNSIIVVSGANMQIKSEEIQKAFYVIEESEIVIAQFETPEHIILEAFKNAKKLGKTTILNPAPAKKIDENLLKYTDIIVPNETEAKVLTGVDVANLEDAKKSAEVFFSKGVKWVIITLGNRGAAVISKNQATIVPAYKVNAIDTTAAGDSFIGALSTKIDSKNITFKSLLEAVKFGNKVSSIVVQKKGAQPSIPYLEEVENMYK
ncbi:ribokinase [Clostridium botulinum]|nr:ribokinase [Clostridium botulinum]